MLVLGVGTLGAESAAWQRILETLVGAAVGILANLVFPPKVATDDAGRAIDGLADTVSHLLTRSAEELEGADPDDPPDPVVWLDDARRITHDIPQVGAALLHAEQGRRLNVRAVGTPDVAPGLRQGLEALEHMAVSIRGLYRAIDEAGLDRDAGPELWPVLVATFRDMAAGVDAFGQLVKDEADPDVRLTGEEVQQVQRAREGLLEARARLEDLLLADSEPVTSRALCRRAVHRQADARRDGPRPEDPPAAAHPAVEPAAPARDATPSSYSRHASGRRGRDRGAAADRPGGSLLRGNSGTFAPVGRSGV